MLGIFRWERGHGLSEHTLPPRKSGEDSREKVERGAGGGGVSADMAAYCLSSGAEVGGTTMMSSTKAPYGAE